MGTSRLGSLLVEEGLLSEADRRTIKGTCGSHGPAFARSIIALGLLDEDELAAFLAEKTPWRVASKDLFADSDQGAWGVVDRPLLERLEVLPLKLVGQTLYVAMVDPLDQDTIKQLAFFSGYKIHPVISTLSHIRSSLQKLLKDYQPASSQLEELIANHAVAAGRRLRLADLKPGATRAPEPKALAAEEEHDDFEIEDEPKAAAPAVAEAPADSSNAALEYPDSVNAAESGDLDIEDDLGEAAPAPVEPANALSADDAAELMGEDPDGLDGLDDFTDDSTADLKGEGDLLADLGAEAGDKPAAAPEKKPSSMAAAAAADDLEDLADLSEFDPDKDEGGGDDLDADLGGLLAADSEQPAADATAEVAAGDEAGEAGADDLFGDAAKAPPGVDNLEELADDDVFGTADALDSPSAPAATAADAAPTEDDLFGDGNEETPATDELGGDLMGLAVAEDDPTDIAVEPNAEPAIEEESLDFEAPTAEAMDAVIDPLAGVDGLESTPEVDDPLAASPAASAAERVTAALNGALLSLTMAKDLDDALKRAAPALSEAGLTRGILIDTSKAKATPLLTWDTSAVGTAVRKDGLASFVTPGLAPALSRQFAGWTAFDDATRDANLEPFAHWTDADHQLRAAAVPLPEGRQLVVLAAWKAETREDQSVKAAALEMIRKLAGKVR